MWVSEGRFRSLSDHVLRLQHKVDCLEGKHVWGESSTIASQPYVRCDYCYVKPKPTGGETK